MYRYRVVNHEGGNSESTKSYRQSLASRDLCGAGDLLLYFGLDFFNDGGALGSMEVLNDGSEVHFKATRRVAVPSEAGFDIRIAVLELRFEDAVWFTLERGPGNPDLRGFLDSEIDGQTERITEAEQHHGGEFHSLTMRFSGGWIVMVFRRLHVVPDDPILWAREIRDPESELELFGLVEADPKTKSDRSDRATQLSARLQTAPKPSARNSCLNIVR